MASELAEAGKSVVLIDVIDNEIPYYVNSTGVKIDQSLNNYGLGGNEENWGKLSSFLTKGEWLGYCQKTGAEISYDTLLDCAKMASLYGFTAIDDFLIDDANPFLERFGVLRKKFIKKNSNYSFSELLENRENIKFFSGSLTDVVYADGCWRLFMNSSGAQEVVSKKIVLAAGGLGNIYIANRLFSSYTSIEKDKYIYLHPKTFIGTCYVDAERKEYEDHFGWKHRNEIDYFYGLIPYDRDGKEYSELMYQVVSARFYESFSLVWLKNILVFRSPLKLIAQFMNNCKVHGRSTVVSPFSRLVAKRIFLASFSVILHFVFKFLKITPLKRKYFVYAHLPFKAKLELKKNDISIDYRISADQIKEAKTKFCKISSSFEGLKFCGNRGCEMEDSSHFIGTLAGNLKLDATDAMFGRIDQKKGLYSIGTSNIPFCVNVNPTYFSLVLSFLTLKDILK
ncbi:MAG: hypothetical protein K6L76_03605 [Agarilytica sp.]